MESLEPRYLLTATLYLDFGLGIGMNGTITPTVANFRDIFGANTGTDMTSGTTTNMTGLMEDDTLTMRPLQYDFDLDNDLDNDDITALANAIVPIVQRALEPFDIDVVVGAAASLAAAATAVGNTAGNDAYNFVTDFVVSGSMSGEVGNLYGLFGRAASIDLGGGSNMTDEATMSFATNMFNSTGGTQGTAQFNQNLAFRLAYTATHEAFHTFGFRHTPHESMGPASANQNLVASGDVIRLGSNTRQSPFMVTRFDLTIENPNNVLQTQNSYEKARDDANIGLRDSDNDGVPDLAYVSGTGAHDRITLTYDSANNEVDVLVEAFSSATHAGTAFASDSYVIDLDTSSGDTEGTILIDGGINNDEIIIDGTIPATIRIRGGEGVDGNGGPNPTENDTLIVQGNGSSTGSYTPVGTDGGTVTVTGGATIMASELEPMEYSGFSSFTFDTMSNAVDDLDVIYVAGGGSGGENVLQITGTIGGSAFEVPSFFDVTNLTIRTQGGADIVDYNVTSNPMGISMVTVETGPADDDVFVRASPSGITTNINTQAGPADKVTVGRGPGGSVGSGSLGNIKGTVNLTDTLAADIEVDNGGDTANRNWTIDSTGANVGRIKHNGITGIIVFDTLIHEDIDIRAGTGNDQFTIDFAGGNPDDPLPFDQFDLFGGGGGGADSIVLQGGGTQNSVTYDFTNSTDGTITFDDFTAKNDLIRYFGFAPITDNLTVTSRTFNYGTGNDSDVRLFNAAGANTAAIEAPANAETVTFNTVGLANLIINLGPGADEITIEPLEATFPAAIFVNTGTENDTVNLIAGGLVAASLSLDGGDPFSPLPADTINIDVTGIPDPEIELIPTATGGQFNLPGLPMAVGIVNFETFGFVGGPVGLIIREDLSPDFADDGNRDAIELNGVATSVNVVVNNVPQMNVPLADLDDIQVIGSNDNDALIVNESGADVIPANGIDYEGGTQTSTPGDTLSVMGSGTELTTYTPDAVVPGKGSVQVDSRTITFTELEPVDISGMLTATLLTPAGDDTLAIANGTDFLTNSVAALRVSGTTGAAATAIETVAFFNNTNVVIDTTLDDQDDVIDINGGTVAHANTNVSIITGTGTDNVDLNGDFTVTGDLRVQTQQINLGDGVGADDITAGNLVSLDAGSGSIVETGTASISAFELALRAATGIGDASINTGDINTFVTRLAATTATGDISVSDDGNLEIRAVDGLPGISISTGGAGDEILIRNGVINDAFDIRGNVTNAGPGKITLAHLGTGGFSDLNIEAEVTAAGGQVTLLSGEDIFFLDHFVTGLSPVVATTGLGDLQLLAGRVFAFGGPPTLGSGDGDIIELTSTEYIVRTEDGNIRLSGTDDVDLSIVNANSDADATRGAVEVIADSDSSGVGEIMDTRSGDGLGLETILGGSVALSAGSGIGDGNAIDVDALTLAFNNSTTGNVEITDTTGGLTIDDVGSLTSSEAAVNATIIALSPLFVNHDVTAAGLNLTLTATDSPAVNDNLTVAAGVRLTAGDDLRLNAGDNIVIGSAAPDPVATLTAMMGGMMLNADTGNDSGGSLTLTNVDIFSDHEVFLRANSFSDTFTLTSVSVSGINASSNNRLDLDGSGGNNDHAIIIQSSVTNPIGDGLFVRSFQSVNVTGGSYSNNGADGIDLSDISGTATVAGVTATGNTAAGVHLDGIFTHVHTSDLRNNGVGIHIHGGRTRADANDLRTNSPATTIGVLLEDTAFVDLGQTVPASDYTTLGVSSGNNDFRGYNAGSSAAHGAIVNFNTNNPNNQPGPQGYPHDTTALNNIFDSPSGNFIETVVFHDFDVPARGLVDYLHLSDLVATVNPTVINENQQVTLNITFNNSPKTHTIDVAWGDGTIQTFNLAQGDLDHTVQHTYVDDNPSGTPVDVYTIGVQVTDQHGQTALDASQMVTVHNLVPFPVFNTLALNPSTIPLGGQTQIVGSYTEFGPADTLFIDVDLNADGIYDDSVPVSGGAFTYNATFNLPVGTHDFNIQIRDDDTGATSATLQVTIVPPPPGPFVAGAHLFYNESVFDGNGPIVTPADFAAIDPTKAPLTFGTPATFANVSGYRHGLNGVFIDVANLPADGAGIDPSDLMVMVGNDNFPDLWAAGPAPSAVGVFPNLGVGGSDRVFVTFASGAIVDTWARLTLKSNLDTGLAGPANFFFGSVPGETGAALVGQGQFFGRDAGDFLSIAIDLFEIVGVGNPNDVTKNAFVDSVDLQVIPVASGGGVQPNVIAAITPQMGAPGVAAATAVDAAVADGQLAVDPLSPGVEAGALGTAGDQRVGENETDERELAFATFGGGTDEIPIVEELARTLASM